jgi:hypothetical protein
MANINNFQTDIDTLSRQYNRFIVSRTILDQRNRLLEIQEPANLPENYSVEISLYSLFDNSLVFNTTITTGSTAPLFTRTLQYSGSNQIRTMLFVDFSKEQLVIPDGEYQAVFNFFSNEFGSYDSRQLFLQDISPSRLEVELELLPEFKTAQKVTELRQTSRPQITAEYVLEAVDQIFGKITETMIPSDNTVFTMDLITSNSLFPEGFNSAAVIQITDITNQILTQSYNSVTQSINQQLTAGRIRFTDMYLNNIISASISASYATLFDAALPTNFDLV